MPFLSIELGKHRFKVLLLERTRETLTILQDLTLTIPPSEDFKVKASGTIGDFIKKYNVTDRKVYLTIADPGVITLRNAVFPVMAPSELVPAIIWHAREEGLLTEDTVLFNYEIVKEFTGDDEAKKLAVTFSVVNKKALESSILMLTRLGLEVTEVSAAPLNTVKILASHGESVGSQVVLDLGYAASTLSIYKKEKLLFLRTLSISFLKARLSLNDPMFLGAKFRTPEADNEIDEAFRSIEISQDASAVGGGGTRAEQFLGLLRPILESLIREIRYSLNYFVSNFREESPGALFLSGNATKIRGLEGYLSSELGLTVSSLNLPPLVHFSEQAAGQDPARKSQCVSVIAGSIPGPGNVDFMPYELRQKKFESFQRGVLRIASLAAVGICLVSFFLVNLQELFFKDRLRFAEKHLATLGRFSQASAQSFPKYHLMRELEKATIPPDQVLRLLGHLIPPGLAVRHFEVDSSRRSMAIELETSGTDEAGNPMVEDLLARLRDSGFFKEIHSKSVPGYSVSVYRLEGDFRDD